MLTSFVGLLICRRHFQMRQHVWINILRRGLAKDAVDMAVARNNVAPVQALTVGLDEAIEGELGADWEVTIV
jgi:hypothetical protein